MVGTRRKSKAAAAAAAEPTSPEPSPAVATSLTVNIPEDVDFDLLSALLPETRFDTPTSETIVSLYRLIVAQATDVDTAQKELEESRAEVQRKDVELDQALQDRETVSKELETVSENLQNELHQVKQEKEQIVASRNSLQAELTSLTTSRSATSSEAELLKQRVDDTEREKRDLVTVISRLKEDATQREEEIHTLRGNLKQARQDYQALEGQLREIRSTETSNKFKLESLTQQLKLARDESERTSADLTAKTEELTKYRRTKHAEFVQLQATHDSLVQNHAATESSLKQLHSSYTAQSHQLTQALARIQDLTGQLAEQEATYSSEAAGLKRLVAMMEDREAQAKAIVENIENEWAGVGDRAERREAVLKEEIESQRQRAEEAEGRVADLQKVLERVDRGEFPVPFGGGSSLPSTPARGGGSPMVNGTPDFLTQGMMGLSPTVAMASRAQRGGKTFTEVYAEYVKLQEELAKKNAEYDSMDRTLTQVLAQIEERAPILAQQRQEYERMQSEATLLASQLAQALAERDSYATAAEENGQKLNKSARENELLTRQLDDLGRQVRTLLKELGRQQDPSIPSDEELEADPSTEPAETIDAVITNSLVLFRSLPELQQQNQRLLKIVHELGKKMEDEEKEYREQLEAEQQVALQEAYSAVKQVQDEMENLKRNSELTIQTYIKERDALKIMLARERSSGRGINGANGHADEMVIDSDTAKELADIQAHFDAYKTEMGVDSTKIREELISVRHEASQAAAQLAKANAKVDYLTERQRMLQDQNSMQSRDLESLTHRNQELYDQYTRIDIQCNRVSEDLLVATSQIDQLRNEAANLRAEKKIWEAIQGRLVEENKNLSMERSQLSDLMANVQRMHHDMERSGENDRRRLENQISMLENQTQELRAQLSQERDGTRHASLQKDLELKELRTRIDKTNEDYAKTRELLAVAETSKKHLDDQVEQLTRQLRGNEEKLAVYERRTTALPGSVQPMDEDMPRDQQLEAEVAELRSALKVAEVDLATAKSHVQQFQEISQANEAALASLNAIHDEYKASSEAQLAKQESEYNALRTQLEGVRQELVQLNQTHTELKQTLATERAAWAQDKKTLEETIIDITTADEERRSRETDVRGVEERAKAAEERYSREVLAHAESIKAAETLRQQLSQAQTTARDNLAAAETAQAKLATSENSWKQQKEALDKEIADLNTRCKDLVSQNSILHQHLESVSSQAARIRSAAESSTVTAAESDNVEDVDTKLAELRSVVAYLRKEKDIVDLQLELGKQESTRFKAQIEHLTHSLEETRKTLSEERERAVEAAASEAQHTELMERINQLSLLRESNATLRADCEAHAKRARAVETQLQQVSSELEPTREQLRIAQAELAARTEQVNRLEQECKGWQDRNTQLLTKYDRIDPAEIQALKDQIEQLTNAKSELEASKLQVETNAAEKLAASEAQTREVKGHVKKNAEISRKRFAQYEAEKNQLSATIDELREQLATLTTERDSLQAKAQNAQSAGSSKERELSQQLQTLQKEKAELEQRLSAVPPATGSVDATRLAQLEAELAQIKAERDGLAAEKATWAASTSTSPEDAQRAWDAEKAELIKARDAADTSAKDSAQRENQMRAQANVLRQTLAKTRQELDEAQKARTADAERANTEQQAALDKLRAELLASTSAPSEDVAKRHAEELRALREQLIKQHQEELKRAVDSVRAAAGGQADPQAVEAAVNARLQELKTKHEEEVAAAVERGRIEAATKTKLKDAQLVRTQSKLKELEAQLEEARKAGFVASAAPVAAATTTQGQPAAGAKPAAGPSTIPASIPPKPVTSVPPKPVLSKPTTIAAARPSLPAVPRPAGSAALPPRPGDPAAAAAGAGAGRGRGAPRGRGVSGAAGLSIRGRGGAPGVPAAGATQTAPAEVSIVGAAAAAAAANKRMREDGDGAESDGSSLAKRLKPAGAAAGGPVKLVRDRSSAS